MPVFYCTYADPQADLEHLKRERNAHRRMFQEKGFQSSVKFMENPDFSQDSLNFVLDRLPEVTVFHFSGHAGMGVIRLSDGTSYLTGIARQMKAALMGRDLPALVLVFLNGCSTGSFVTALMDAGVPLVIGTSAPVDDGSAADFSIHFYTALLWNSKTIREAFNYACDKLVTNRRQAVPVTRSIGVDQGLADEPLWGLFYKPERAGLLDWRLQDDVGSDNREAVEYVMNGTIRPALYASLARAAVPEIMELQKLERERKDIRSKLNRTIAEAFPGPISYQLMNLFRMGNETLEKSEEEVLRDHLLNLYLLHQSMSELLFHIMISQLWEICLDVGNVLRLSPELPVARNRIREELDALRFYFEQPRSVRLYIDYLPKIRAIRKIFDAAEKKAFVPEIEDLKLALQEDTAFMKAHIHFTWLRETLRDGNYHLFDKVKWKRACQETEMHLANIFETAIFCCRYDFGVLRQIEMRFYRYQSKPGYTYGLLRMPKDGNTDYIVYSPTMAGYTSVRSVVMLKSEHFENADTPVEITGQINLAPFILDYNMKAPSSMKGNLLIYSHFDAVTGSYVYEEALRKDRTQIFRAGDASYTEIHQTFNEIKRVFFGQEPDASTFSPVMTMSQ